MTKLKSILLSIIKEERLKLIEISDPDMTEFKRLLIKKLKYKFPLKVAIKGTLRGFPDFYKNHSVPDKNKLADLIISSILEIHDSLEEYREYMDDYQGDASSYNELVNSMGYESTNNWVICSIDEDTALIIPSDDEDDE